MLLLNSHKKSMHIPLMSVNSAPLPLSALILHLTSRLNKPYYFFEKTLNPL